jgi:hypothetical protein
VAPKDAMEFNLSNIHWLDAFTPPVKARLELLAASVNKLLGKEFDQRSRSSGAPGKLKSGHNFLGQKDFRRIESRATNPFE